MDEWKENVQKELEELSARSERLMRFVNSRSWENLEDRQRTLLARQLSVMLQYQSILLDRLH